MNYLNVAIVALLFLSSGFAKNAPLSKADLARNFGMPELFSIRNDQDLAWFRAQNHITDRVFFHGVLMSELKKTGAFGQNRVNFAKYCLRTYLNMNEADQALVDVDGLNRCVKILVDADEFDALFEFSVKRGGDKMISLLYNIEIVKFKPLVRALLVSSFMDRFLAVVRNHHRAATVFTAHFYGQLILSDASEELYVDQITSDANLLISSAFVALGEYLSQTPFNVEGINKIQGLFGRSINPVTQGLMTNLKDSSRIVMADDNVLLEGLEGFNLNNMDFNQKLALLLNSANHNKDSLFRQVVGMYTDDENFLFLRHFLASAKAVKPSGLKVAVKLYNALAENVREPINSTQDYLQAAVQWLKLSRLEILEDGDFDYKIIFKADTEQIASGLFPEMVYFHRRAEGKFPLLNNYGAELKFESAEALENFITQNIKSLFDEMADGSFVISKNTLELFARNENLRIIAATLELKLVIQEVEILEFFEENDLETVPEMRNLIRDTFILFNLLSKFNEPLNLAKLEKFTGKSIDEIVLAAVSLSLASPKPADYFKIRNALIYWKESGNFGRLNELPVELKKELLKEFPDLRNNLTVI